MKKMILVASLAIVLAFALGFWVVSAWLARAVDCSV